MTGSVLVQLAFFLLVIAPIAALFLAFKGSEGTRRVARFTLVCAWLVHGAATLWCVWTGFFVKSTGVGVGNGVFVIIAMPLAVFTGVLFSVWWAAVQHEERRSLGSGWRP